MKRKVLGHASIVFVLLFCAPALASPARATPSGATFVVDSLSDDYDAVPGNGQCVGAVTGKCTLRAAVMESNALAGADTITLQADAVYTLNRASAVGDGAGLNGDLDIADDLTINGQNASIVGSAPLADRLFEVNPEVHAQFANLTIRNATAFGDGGGIRNSGTLTLTNAILSGNATPGTGGGVSGATGSTTTLLNSRLTGNQATMGGGGIALAFGAIAQAVNTTVMSNTAQFGGGVYNNYGIFNLRHSTVSLNSVQYSGGGIYTIFGTTRLVNSTVTANNAPEFGGGLYNASGIVVLYNATMVFNEADSDNDEVGGGGGFYTTSGTFTLKNSIVARNRLERGIFDQANDCAGNPSSLGYNLIQAVTCTINTATGDQSGVDPLVQGLADNGGPTRTHGLAVGSPAIDAANPAGCEDNNGIVLLTDQRGFNRTVNGDAVPGARCDIGAFEYQQLTRLFLPLVTR